MRRLEKETADKRESRLGKTCVHRKLRRKQETFEEREARSVANRQAVATREAARD